MTFTGGSGSGFESVAAGSKRADIPGAQRCRRQSARIFGVRHRLVPREDQNAAGRITGDPADNRERLRQPGPAAGLASRSIRPIRCRNTSGGFWAGWLCCLQRQRHFCCASLRRQKRLHFVWRRCGACFPCATPHRVRAVSSPAQKHSALLNVLKEELSRWRARRSREPCPQASTPSKRRRSKLC